MSRRLIVGRREPMGSPRTSSLRKSETPQSSPRTTALASTRNENRYGTPNKGMVPDDPNVSTLATAPPESPSRSNSFLEQLNDGPPESEMAPEEGALQFNPSFGGIPGSSWSDTDDKGDQFLLKEDEKKEDRATVVTTSTAFAQRARLWKRTQTERRTNKPKSSTPVENNNYTRQSPPVRSNSGGRIARLASLFGSRATVRSGSTTTATTDGTPAASPNAAPQAAAARQTPSPAPSSNSSGYVGWPGTQDKGGHTVSLPSSYDDSSAGGPRRSNPSLNGTGSEFSRRNFSSMHYAQKQQSPPPPPPPPPAAEEPNFWQHFPEWDGDATPSSPSTISKTSSAYFQPRELGQLAYPDLGDGPDQGYGVNKNLTATIVRRSVTPATATPGTSGRPNSTPRSAQHPQASPRSNYQMTSTNASPRPTYQARSSPTISPRTSFTPRGTPTSSPQANYGTTPRGSHAAWTPKSSNYASARQPDSPGRAPVTPNTGTQSLTKERLAVRDHLSSSSSNRPFAAAKGYSALLQKTKDVPSLMDDVNSDTSSRATSAHTQSDVFDGLSTTQSDVFDNLPSPRRAQVNMPEQIKEEDEEEDEFQVVTLGGGLTVVQSSAYGFSNRATASDYDENLTDSDVDNRGFARTPDLKIMLTAGTNADSALSGIHGNIGNRPRPMPTRENEYSSDDVSGSSMFSDPYVNSFMDLDGDLAEYYIDPLEMKKVLRKYRKFAEYASVDLSLTELEKAEDESKAFALFEMRSRIMEKDIERGLERRGGTSIVDDLVTTRYYREAQRIRDAVIVSKAWRDGTSPGDVINAAVLTRRGERSFFIKRKLSQGPSTRYSRYSSTSYYWEPVRWVDDTDFSLYRCSSLGPRHLRGFEMFTVGDCQSILLKLTNERCQELRLELNEATKAQIEAEEIMKAEGDDGDGMMTDAEMTYLTAMEEVKTISKKLVAAEQSFALVKDRVEKLVAKYQALLLKIETESFTGASSIITYGSSHYSDHDSAFWDEEEAREAALWARRARRAEVKAEVAAREALLARQEAQMVREEKERELEALRQKLTELQSESSQIMAERVLATRLMGARSTTPSQPPPQQTVMSSERDSEKKKLDGVKQRFRDRMAARKRKESGEAVSNDTVRFEKEPARHSYRESYQASLMRSAGEEMYQQLDFYERSLKAVERSP